MSRRSRNAAQHLCTMRAAVTVLVEGREGKALLSQRRHCCKGTTLLQGMRLLGRELSCSTVGDLQPFQALNCRVALGGAQCCSGASGYLCWIHPGLTFISVNSRKALTGWGFDRRRGSSLFFFTSPLYLC